MQRVPFAPLDLAILALALPLLVVRHDGSLLVAWATFLFTQFAIRVWPALAGLQRPPLDPPPPSSPHPATEGVAYERAVRILQARRRHQFLQPYLRLHHDEN